MSQNALTETLRRQSAIGFILRIGSAGAGFLFTIIAAAMLGPAEFGVYAWIMAAVILLASLANFGWPALILREVARESEAGDQSALGGLFAAGLLTALLMGLAIATAIGFGAPFLRGAFPILGGTSVLVISCAAMIIPLQAIAPVRAGFLRGLHKPISADIPELVVRPAASILLIIGLSISAREVIVESLLVIQVVSIALALLVSVPLVRAAWQLNGPLKWPKGWFRSAAVFWLIGPIGMLLVQLPLYLLGILSAPAEAGQFAFAMQFASIISLIIVSIELPVQSRIAAAYQQRDFADVEQITRATGKTLIYVSLGVSLAIIAGMFLMVRVLGPQWGQAIPLLAIICVGNLFYAVSGPCRVALSMTGHEKLVLIILACVAAISLVIGYQIIPEYGALGAAILVASSTVLLNFALYVACSHKLQISTSPLLPARQ